MIKKSIELPAFEGYFDSIWENDGEWQYFLQQTYGEMKYLDEWEFDYDRYIPEFNEAYVDATAAYYREVFPNVGLTLTPDGNGTTGSGCWKRQHIYANIEISEVQPFKARINELILKHEGKLREVIYQNHTSYDGFWSFMSNKLEDWMDLYLDDERYLGYLVYYLTMLELDCNNLEIWLYEDLEVRQDEYWKPESERAKAEWDEVTSRYEEKRWTEAHVGKLF